MLHDLAPVRAVYDALGGFPVPAVHIAGSKGKGTTATLLAKIAELNGDRVGLFTSPAIVSETEMIQVNGNAIPLDALIELKERIVQIDPNLSEFELQTLSALEWFKEEQCDLVVLECGWGGREDATNIIEEKALTIVTHIELEHADVLGPTLKDIVYHKLGIARAGVPLLTSAEQIPEFFTLAKEAGFDPLLAPRVSLGAHHPESVGLALMGAELLGYEMDSVIEEALAQLQLPGRFELRSFGPHTLLLDGAHTYDSVKFVLEQVLEYQRTRALPEPRFAIHFLKDKNPELPELFPQDRTVWVPLNEARAGTCPPTLQTVELEALLDELRTLSIPEFWVFVGSFRLAAHVNALTNRFNRL